MTNALYELPFTKYLQHVYETLSQEWFKQACKDKKIRISYLEKKNFSKKNLTFYAQIEKNKIIFGSKIVLLKFYYEKLPNNNHIKLLNINLKNETLYRFSSLLFQQQENFLISGCYKELLLLKRDVLISSYKEIHNLYIDTSLVSKIVNNNFIFINTKKYPLSLLIPKKSFIYSLYIKEIIYMHPDKISDSAIAIQLKEKKSILLSRREVCFIRKKYLISNIYERQNTYFYNSNEKLFCKKEPLLKENITTIRVNLKGIYELSTTLQAPYPLRESKTIYIGSSKDIKNRLLSYVSNNAHTLKLKNFILSNTVYFRYIHVTNHKELEMLFLNGFIALHGDLPLLNKQRIKEH